jgi:hypothetical protein
MRDPSTPVQENQHPGVMHMRSYMKDTHFFQVALDVHAGIVQDSSQRSTRTVLL